MKNKKKTIPQPTLLTETVKTGDLRAVMALVRSGAPLNGRNPDGTTALFWAARIGAAHIVNFLIEEGADVLARDSVGNTASTWAYTYNHPKITQLLALYSKGPTGDSPLMKAIEFNYRDFIPSLLKQKRYINVKNFDGNTALMIAASHGHLDLVLTLIAHGAEVSFQNPQGQTAMDLAEQQGHTEIAQWLSHYQAVHLGKQVGNTPLMRAAKWGYEDIIPFLIENENHKGAKNQQGDTALSLAAQYGYQRAVARLLEAKVELDQRNNQGYTALMLAAKNGYYNIVHLLLEAGADLDIANAQGETALSFAAKGGYKELVNLLLIKGASIPNIYIHHKNKALAQLIGQYQAIGANVKEGETPLMRAIKKGYGDLTKLWVAKGANVNARNDKNETPLMLAIQYGDIQITKFLIEKGAQLNVMDKVQKTALNRARQLWFRNKEIALLLMSGATVTPRSEEAYGLKTRMLPLLSLCLQKGDLISALNVFKTCLHAYSDVSFSNQAHAILKRFFLDLPAPSLFEKCLSKVRDYFYPKEALLRAQVKKGLTHSPKERSAYEILVSSLVLNAPLPQRQAIIEQIVEKSEPQARYKLRQKLYSDYDMNPPALLISYQSPKPAEFFKDPTSTPELLSRRSALLF